MTLAAVQNLAVSGLTMAPGLAINRNAPLHAGHFPNLPAAIGDISGVAAPFDLQVRGSLKSGVDLCLFDNRTWSERRIETRFTYPLLEILEKFPDAPRVGAQGDFRRPLVYASFGELTEDILFLGLVETNPDFRGRGIGVAFYDTLVALARQAGYRAVGHYHNDKKTAEFFLRRGCFFWEEIPADDRPHFDILRKQEDDPAVYHTLYFLDSQDPARPVARPTSASRTEDSKTISSLHFLVHPLFVSDPVETDDSDRNQGYAEASALTGLYLEKARSLPENGVLFLFSHLNPVNLHHPSSGYRTLYRGFLNSLHSILGERLFLRDDRDVFDDLSAAGSLNAELKRRGFRLSERTRAFAYGEVPELCVADAAENLREGFDLQDPVLIETRYSSWKSPYRGEYPRLEEELRERGLVLG